MSKLHDAVNFLLHRHAEQVANHDGPAAEQALKHAAAVKKEAKAESAAAEPAEPKEEKE